jgi:hypothetical protein
MLLGVFASATGTGTVDAAGEPISSGEFLRTSGILVGFLGILSIAIGVGLFRERSWARWLIAFHWLLALAGAVGAGWGDGRGAGAALGAAQALPGLLVAYWYLFFKENVVAYYRALEAHERAGGLTQVTGGA